VADRPIAGKSSRSGHWCFGLRVPDGAVWPEVDVLRMRLPDSRTGLHPILRSIATGAARWRTARRLSLGLLRRHWPDVRLRSLPHGPPRLLDLVHEPVLRHRSVARQRRHGGNSDPEQPLGVQHPLRAAVVLGLDHYTRHLLHTGEPVVVGANGEARGGARLLETLVV